MQYGQPVPQEKIIFLWRLQSFHGHMPGFNFDIMNTLHEFAASPMLEKTSSIFQITISRLFVKANKIYI